MVDLLCRFGAKVVLLIGVAANRIACAKSASRDMPLMRVPNPGGLRERGVSRARSAVVVEPMQIASTRTGHRVSAASGMGARFDDHAFQLTGVSWMSPTRTEVFVMRRRFFRSGS